MIYHPDFVIFGAKRLDPVQYTLFGSDHLGSVNSESVHSAMSMPLWRYTLEFYEGQMGSGMSYGEAFGHLQAAGFTSLRDPVTHARISNVVADALEVTDDDTIVQKIAAAIMDSGVILAT